MRFLASVILGSILRVALRAAAAFLFQKVGSSSSTGKGHCPHQLMAPIPPGHPVVDTPKLRTSLGSHSWHNPTWWGYR